jgi:hypothetical protein
MGDETELFWRKKIADDVETAWANLVLKNYYTGNLAVEMIVDYIRSGNNEDIQ